MTRLPSSSRLENRQTHLLLITYQGPIIRSHPRTLVEPRSPAGIGCINDEGTGVDSASVELAEGVIEQGKGQATFAPGGTYPNLTDPPQGPLLAHLKLAQGHSRDLVPV